MEQKAVHVQPLPPSPSTSPTTPLPRSVKGAKELRPYQQDAVAAISRDLEEADRCQVRAACGMGKTVIAQGVIVDDVRKNGADNLYVVVTSSIRLTRQTRGDFEDDGIITDMSAFSVHHGSLDLDAARKGSTDTLDADVSAIAEFISAPSVGPRVVFVTYDSVHKVAAAQQRVGERGRASVTVLDESHNLGGEYGVPARPSTSSEEVSHTSVPRVFYDGVPGSLQSRSRVFFSATPTVPDERDHKWGSKRYTEQMLTAIALREDEGREPIRSRLYHTDFRLFGRPSYSKGLAFAVEQRALVPLEVTAVRVTVRGSSDPDLSVMPNGEVSSAEGSMSRTAYIATASTVESLASGEGHNALVFSSRITEAEEVARRWKDVALSAAGQNPPTLDEARRRLVNGEGDQKQARKVMLAHYARVVAASSKSSEREREAAYSHFDSQTLGDRGCDCGRPGGWCACVRVVSNVDLFGEGISISSVDTVMIADATKSGDTALTQAIGRAMRRWDSGGKQRGRVVIPEVVARVDDRLVRTNHKLTGQIAYGISRLHRDSLGSTIEGRPVDAPQRNSFVIHTPEGGRDILDYTRTVSGDPLSSALLDTSWSTLSVKAKERHRDRAQHVPDSPRWEQLSSQQRHEEILSYAAAPDPELALEASIVSRVRPSRSRLSTARSTVGFIKRRVDGYDRDALSVDETTVADILGLIPEGGRRRPTRQSASKTERLWDLHQRRKKEHG